VALNRADVPTRIPRRDEIESPGVRWLKRAGPTKADLLVVDSGEGPLVVKDFGRKAAWVRLIGRIQISRECRAYRWLGPMPGLPRLVGRIDKHALALEWIEGELLAFVPQRRETGAATHAKLREIVERMHDAGLVHLDLRGKDNVLVAPDGKLFVLDLAGAVWFRPGGWAHKLFFGLFQKTDRAALMKWNRILGAGPFTAEEESFLRRYRFWRALWIFNRKRPPDA
jgi:hypothetical protein